MHPLDLVKTRFQLQSNVAAAANSQVTFFKLNVKAVFSKCMFLRAIQAPLHRGAGLHGQDVPDGGAALLLEGGGAAHPGRDAQAGLEVLHLRAVQVHPGLHPRPAPGAGMELADILVLNAGIRVKEGVSFRRTPWPGWDPG